jgi:hypothetical protein
MHSAHASSINQGLQHGFKHGAVYGRRQIAVNLYGACSCRSEEVLRYGRVFTINTGCRPEYTQTLWTR